MKKNELHKNEPDNLFKDELENRSFEFEESYWADAEKKIEDYERSGKLCYKRRTGWWWWGSAIALLVLVSGLYLFSGWFDLKGEEHISEGGKQISITQSHNDSFTQSSDTVRSKIIVDTQQDHPETDNLIGMKDEKNQSSLTGNFKHSADKHHQEKEEIFTFNSAGEKQNDAEEVKLNAEKNNLNAETQQTVKSEKNSDINSVYSEKEKNPVQDITENYDTSTIVSMTLEDAPALDSALIESEGSNPLDPEKKMHFFIGLHFGVDYVTKNVAAQGSQLTLFQLYVNQREKEEAPILASSAGITAGIDIRNFNLTTGFTSYRLGEKVNYSISGFAEDSTLTTEFVTTSYFDTTGVFYDTAFIVIDSVLVIDSIYTFYLVDTLNDIDTISNVTYISVNSTVNKRDTNLISYFEILVLFGYEIEKRKWRFNFQTGPSLGIYRFSSGNVIDTNLESFAPLTETEFFTKLSYNWLLTPSVAYKINENFELGLQPWLRFNLKSIALDEGIKLRYQTYGLHAAVVYHF